MNRKGNMYDLAMGPLENGTFHKIRRRLIEKAKGRVLEIGSGTGVNFLYYRNVEEVVAIDPNEKSVEISRNKIRRANVPIEVFPYSAEQLPFPNDYFDSVVATLVFCTIPDPEKALAEIKRVVKPGAPILFFEHVKMEQPFFALVQDMLNPLWKRVANGCHINRDTEKLIRKSGFHVQEVSSNYKGLFVAIECANMK